MTPNDRKYTKEHEWILVEGDVATIGITDYAQQEMGDIVYVELPAVDDDINAGDILSVVESVKAVSSVYSAVAGTIAEANDALEGAPEILNESPYENWIGRVKLAGELDESNLMDAEAYDAYVAKLQAEAEEN